MKKTERGTAVLIVAAFLPIALHSLVAQQPSIAGYHGWTPATDVFRSSGEMRPEYAVPPNLEFGLIQFEGEPQWIGPVIRRWRQDFLDRYGSASELGLRDGSLPDSREYCVETMVSTEHLKSRKATPPAEFDEWVSRSEAIVEGHVVEITPGFDGWGDPAMLIALDVVKHLYAPEKPFATRLHLSMPVGEFVAGDAVFCSRETWGGYRPRVGDKLIVGAFFRAPDAGSSVLLNIDRDQVFLVDDDGGLVRLHRRYESRSSVERQFVRLADGLRAEVPADGFPRTLPGFSERVHELWRIGATAMPSLGDETEKDLREWLNRAEDRKASKDPDEEWN